MWLSNDLNYKVAGGDQYLLSVRLHQLIAQQPTVQCSVHFTVGCTTAIVVLGTTICTGVVQLSKHGWN